MTEDILVVKKKKDRLEFAVKEKRYSGYSDADYKNVINVKDYKQLALLLEDLRILFGAPIDKAISEMREKKSPFW